MTGTIILPSYHIQYGNQIPWNEEGIALVKNNLTIFLVITSIGWDVLYIYRIAPGIITDNWRKTAHSGGSVVSGHIAVPGLNTMTLKSGSGAFFLNLRV